MVYELVDEVVSDVTWCVEQMASEIIDELVCFVQSSVIIPDEISNVRLDQILEQNTQPLYLRIYHFKTDLSDCCYDLLNFNLSDKLSNINNQLSLTHFNDKNLLLPDMNGLINDIGNFLANASISYLTRPAYLNSITRTVLQMVRPAPNIVVFKFKVFGELQCILRGLHTQTPIGLHTHLGYSMFGPGVPRLQDLAMLMLLSHKESYIRGKIDILPPELIMKIEKCRCLLSCSDMSRVNLNHSLITPAPSVHHCNYHFGCYDNNFVGTAVRYRG